MLKYILLARSRARSWPPRPRSQSGIEKDIEEAVKREQRIKDLSAPPRSAHNICKGC